jgi:hypothetical protein
VRTPGQKLLDETRRKLPGQEVRYVFTGQWGIPPVWRWWTLGLLDPLLVFVMRPRIVAVTSDSIIVMSTGILYWNQKTPRDVLVTVPRATVLGPPRHRRWTRIEVGREKVWVARAVYPLLEKANAEIATEAN